MKCPLPRYYLCHVVVALAIAVIVGAFFWLPFGMIVSIALGLGVGSGFYIGREFTQSEQGGGAGLPFDWKGLVAPVATCLVVLAAICWGL